MTHYQQADTLSLDTAAAVSGSGGTSTPESAAGDANYAAWPWETILATVLNIPIADRSEVTGQPWLTVVQDGQPGPGPGAHLIWTANWTTKPKSGATSLQVFLSPALYAGGGAWDRFVNAPAQALSGPAADLPLIPATFHTAQAAIAGVTTGILKVSTRLGLVHHNVTQEDVPLHGNAASVMGELFSDLHGATLSLYDQLSSPSYSDAVGAAGDSATTFLGDLSSAYGAWSALGEHSPLGAVVQVLTSIATPDGNGGYTIADPQNTPLGDLTSPGAWDSVEQQAKNIWLGPITGNSADFDGLDLLGRAALTKMVGQFTTTTGTVAPVVGPATPPVTQTPVGGPPGNGGPPANGNGPVTNGGGPVDRSAFPPGAGPPSPGGPAPGNGLDIALATSGGGGGSQPLPAPGGAGGPVGQGPGPVGQGPGPVGQGAGPAGTGVTMPGVVGAPVLAAQAFAVPAGTGAGPGLPMPGGPGLSLLASPGADREAQPSVKNASAGLDLPSTAGVLAGAIGATPVAGGGQGRETDVAGEPGKGFTGTVGRTPKVNGPVGENRAHAGIGDSPHGGASGSHHGGASGRGGRTAPPAGFSLGAASNGAMLPQSAVPVVASRPPAITSSPVNTALTPTSVDGGPLPAQPAQLSLPAGSRAGSGVLLADGGASSEPGANGPMMMPPQAQGGRGEQATERQRRAYLPEEEDYWGTDTLLLSPGVDAIDDEDEDEEEFDCPRLSVGIGAEAAPAPSNQTMSEWRIG